MTDYSEFPTSAQEIIEDLENMLDGLTKEHINETTALRNQAADIIAYLTLDQYRNLVQENFVEYVSDIPLAHSKDVIRERLNDCVPGMVREGWVNRAFPADTAMKIAYKVGAFDKAM